MPNQKDISIIRSLAEQTASLAALPIQETKRDLWRKLNGLKPVRPMVMIDQVCWNEMNGNDELTLRCTDPECRTYEQQLRRKLYQWKHFPVDMVIDPYVCVPMAIENSVLGIEIQEETALSDPENDVVSHQYKNQFVTEADLEKIRMPVISHDEAETNRRMEVAEQLFGGLLELQPQGFEPYLSLWDPIAQWMGMENALYALIDEPEYMHRLLSRMADGYLMMLDMLEEQGLLCKPQSLVHCTGAYSDELPAAGYDPNKPRTKDNWTFGLAQMLGTVSPTMFQEFEIEYIQKICARFGLVYYGCCEPLDSKMNEVRMLPNVRKISISPWANEERAAKEIGGDYVFSRKPNPSYVAMEHVDMDQIRTDLIKTKELCDDNGCPLEFILKDLSTVRYQPQRLTEWGRVAMEVVGA